MLTAALVSLALVAPAVAPNPNFKPSSFVESRVATVQKEAAESAQRVMPSLHKDFQGRPHQEAHAALIDKATGREKLTGVIKQLQHDREQYDNALAEATSLLQQQDKDSASLNAEMKKVLDQSGLSTEDGALKDVSTKLAEQERAVKQSAGESARGSFEARDAISQYKAASQLKFRQESDLDAEGMSQLEAMRQREGVQAMSAEQARKVLQLQRVWMSVAGNDTIKAFHDIFSSSLRKAANNTNMQKVLNSNTRQFFHGVYHMPAINHKMAAVENYIQYVDFIRGVRIRDDRLTEREVEAWLTTDYLGDDLANKEIAYILMPGMIPPGLKSRPQEFIEAFHGAKSCAPKGLKTLRSALHFNYGKWCGLSRMEEQRDADHGSIVHPITSKEKACISMRREKVGVEFEDVCADGGVDKCCARHDMVTGGATLSHLMNANLCKADREFQSCVNKVQPVEKMFDTRGVSEADAKTAISCVYSVIPCLKKNHFRKMDIDWKRGVEDALVFKGSEERGEHNYHLSFPFEDDLVDETPLEEVYRPRRDASSDSMKIVTGIGLARKHTK